MDAPRRMMAWHDINHDAEYIILAEMVTSRPFRSLRVLAKDMTILRVLKLFVKFVRNLNETNGFGWCDPRGRHSPHYL